ncbi:nuclear transport factor 2 family protein [Glaciihabitans sp. INWT7]|uniref:nuclear transport factor 2 family protein n=1 Tax=Glaciihabitans sp. INWT7 TaxID=2596912 RepID=UPI00186227CE|nr:nuclear transport factor 2 family protein [Glaciihabitans sp. INWT7]
MLSECVPKGVYTAQQLDLVRRQISFWETNSDTARGSADWRAEGVLTAPRGVREESGALAAVVETWHRSFRDLHIEILSLFGSADGEWLAIEWTWQVTRKSDGATGTTTDAIIVELHEGRIASWREYFDTFGSVEFT